MDQASSGDTGSPMKVEEEVDKNESLPSDMAPAGDGRHNSPMKKMAGSGDVEEEHEVFLDESTVDFLLQKRGGPPENLKRLSLYTRFDPLVSPRLPNEPVKDENRIDEEGGINADNKNDSSLREKNQHSHQDKNPDNLPMVIAHDLVIIDESICKTEEEDSQAASVSSEGEAGVEPQSTTNIKSPELNVSKNSLEIQESSKTPEQTKNITSTPNSRRSTGGLDLTPSRVSAFAYPSVRRDNTTLVDDNSVHEEVALLREILVKQEVTYREDLNLYQQQVNRLQAELKNSEAKRAALRKKVATSCEEGLQAVMSEYEQTIGDLINEKNVMQHECEQQYNAVLIEYKVGKDHLHTLEEAFADLHRKYQKAKDEYLRASLHIEHLQSNIGFLEESLLIERDNFKNLKQHASEVLETANRTFNEKEAFHQAELDKLRAILKKSELQIHSLEEGLQQKTKENKDLMQICDDLINKFGNQDKI